MPFEQVGAIPFRFTNLLNTAAVIAGSNNRRKYIYSDRFPFVVTAIVGRAYNVAAQANLAAAGTNLATFSDPSPPATNPNAWPSINRIQTRFSIGRWFFSDDVLDWPNFVGTIDKPFKPDRLIVIAPKVEAGIELTTDITFALAGDITFHGFYTDDVSIRNLAITGQ